MSRLESLKAGEGLVDCCRGGARGDWVYFDFDHVFPVAEYLDHGCLAPLVLSSYHYEDSIPHTPGIVVVVVWDFPSSVRGSTRLRAR